MSYNRERDGNYSFRKADVSGIIQLMHSTIRIQTIFNIPSILFT